MDDLYDEIQQQLNIDFKYKRLYINIMSTKYPHNKKIHIIFLSPKLKKRINKRNSVMLIKHIQNLLENLKNDDDVSVMLLWFIVYPFFRAFFFHSN